MYYYVRSWKLFLVFCVLAIESVFALWLFSTFFSVLFKDPEFGIFYVSYPCIILSMIFFIGGQFYLYIHLSKRKNYQALQEHLAQCNAVVSTKWDQLHCLTCGLNAPLIHTELKWNSFGSMYYVAPPRGSNKRILIIPLCSICLDGISITQNGFQNKLESGAFS